MSCMTGLYSRELMQALILKERGDLTELIDLRLGNNFVKDEGMAMIHAAVGALPCLQLWVYNPKRKGECPRKVKHL